jgi:hypothetical protein
VLGAPLAYAVAYLFALHRYPNPFELLLGPAGALVGGAALFVPAWYLARWHMRRRLTAVRDAVERMGAAVRRLLWGSGLPPDQEAQPSIRSFLESRLELTGAVATRGFALRVLERAVADSKLAYRLTRSVDVQLQLLSRRGEALGVRSRLADGPDRQEDVRKLFDGRTSGTGDRLIDPEDLDAYYRNRVGRREDLPDRMRDLIKEAGGFAHWREQAALLPRPVRGHRLRAHLRAALLRRQGGPAAGRLRHPLLLEPGVRGGVQGVRGARSRQRPDPGRRLPGDPSRARHRVPEGPRRDAGREAHHRDQAGDRDPYPAQRRLHAVAGAGDPRPQHAQPAAVRVLP